MEQIINSEPSVIRSSRGLSVGGTRITLYAVMDYIKDGWHPHLIRDWLNLTDKQIQDVMRYIEIHREEVESEYQAVLKYAEEIERYWREHNREHLAKIAAMPPKPGHEKIRAMLDVRKAKWNRDFQN